MEILRMTLRVRQTRLIKWASFYIFINPELINAWPYITVWITGSILRAVPSIQSNLSPFQWNLYIIEFPRVVFGGNSTKIWNSARLIKLPIGFLRTVATTNSEEFCRNSRNRLWEQIFQRILFKNFTSETISSKFFDTKLSLTQGSPSICQISMAYLGCRHLSVCLVSLFAGAKDWTSDAGNQKRRPLFLLQFPKHNVLDTCPLQCENQFRGSFGHTLKIGYFRSTLGGNKDFYQHSERTCVSSKQCIFVISSQRYYDKYPACLHPARVEGLFTGKCRCILYKHGWGLREQWCANSLESLLTGVLSRPSLQCAPPCLRSTSISTSSKFLDNNKSVFSF